MSDERCETCRFWQDSMAGRAVNRHGTCRRFPPAFDEDGAERNPMTHEKHWCGEYKAKETE